MIWEKIEPASRFDVINELRLNDFSKSQILGGLRGGEVPITQFENSPSGVRELENPIRDEGFGAGANRPSGMSDLHSLKTPHQG